MKTLRAKDITSYTPADFTVVVNMKLGYFTLHYGFRLVWSANNPEKTLQLVSTTRGVIWTITSTDKDALFELGDKIIHVFPTSQMSDIDLISEFIIDDNRFGFIKGEIKTKENKK